MKAHENRSTQEFLVLAVVFEVLEVAVWLVHSKHVLVRSVRKVNHTCDEEEHEEKAEREAPGVTDTHHKKDRSQKAEHASEHERA